MPASASAETRYKVVGGDNIRAIADKMSVPIDEVLRANPQVTDPNRIWPGMTLNIPDSSPLAGGAGISDGEAPSVPNVPSGPRIEEQAKTGSDTVREGVPEGLLRLSGITWRGRQDAYDIVVPDCGTETCTATVTVQNVGAVPVEGLKVTHSSWYYMLKVEEDCGPLQPGEECHVTVRHAEGFKAKSPGFVVIQASDAFIRPPDDETIWFWDTVFWICPVADDERCHPDHRETMGPPQKTAGAGEKVSDDETTADDGGSETDSEAEPSATGDGEEAAEEEPAEEEPAGEEPAAEEPAAVPEEDSGNEDIETGDAAPE